MTAQTRRGPGVGSPDLDKAHNTPLLDTEGTAEDRHVAVRRPFGREALQQMSCDWSIPVKDMLVMHRNNDPFNCGTNADTRDGEWFASAWDRFDIRPGAHLRRVHYAILGRASRPNGEPYENTEKCWKYLLKASAKARDLGLIDARWFVDRRNAEPMLIWEPRPAPTPWVTWMDPDWTIPTPMIAAPSILEPETYVDGYDLEPGDHPVHVEVVVEKSTMNDILIPVCERLGVNLAAATGFTSHTRLVELLERARHGRPVRILYLSDFDPAGTAMPISAARYIEFLVRNDDDGDDLDIALEPLVLTAEQCSDYELPRIPIKGTDARRGRFEERHGDGATELDALEALHPGELAEIVTEAVEAYRDPTHQDRLTVAECNAITVVADARRAALGNVLAEVADVRHAAHAAYERLAEVIAPHVDAYEDEIEPLRHRLGELADEYTSTTEDLDVDLPERPDAVAFGLEYDDDWLYRSDRSYMSQLEAYREAGR